jgi:hypothetical protein
MKQMKPSSDLGSAKSPIDFGQGSYAYRRNGKWRYRDPETTRKFGDRFVEVTDQELIVELETRGYMILYPAHECVDRPHLPCPACRIDEHRLALRTA